MSFVTGIKRRPGARLMADSRELAPLSIARARPILLIAVRTHARRRRHRAMQEQHHPDLGTTKSGLQPNVAGLIAYLPFWIGLVASIYFLATEKENHFVRFHSMQSLFLSLAGLVLWLPFFALGLLPVAMILSLALLVAWI
jgi:uncharacterized membrane protein